MQQSFAEKVFALADFRRFLLGFKIISDQGATDIELENKLRQNYGKIADALFLWSSTGGELLGGMCEKSLSSLGIVDYATAGMATNGLDSTRAWHATPLTKELSPYVHFLQEEAYILGVGTNALFSRLSGANAKAPLNKALIISELAARAGHEHLVPVHIGDLEGRVGMHSHTIHGHLLQFEKFRLVCLDDSPEQVNGKVLSYCWISDDAPPEMPDSKKKQVVAAIYRAHQEDPHAFVPASAFYPSLFAGPPGVRRALSEFLDSGQMVKASNYYLRNVNATELLIEVAVKMVDPVLAAIAGNSQSLETVAAGAQSFREREHEKLESLAKLYVAESKII